MNTELTEPKKKDEKSLRKYLKSAKALFAVVQWAWQNIMTEKSKMYTRGMLFFMVLLIVCLVIQPAAISYIFDGLVQKDDAKVWIAFGAFLTLVFLQKLFDRFFCRMREFILGDNFGALEKVICNKFFGLSVGQHIQESASLSPATINKGKERMLMLQGILLFDVFQTLFNLFIAMVLLCILSGVGGGMMIGIVALYVAWSFYLNFKIDQEMKPIDRDMRKLVRRRFSRFEGVERVRVTSNEKLEEKEMCDEFDNIIGRDRKFWLFYIDNAFWRSQLNLIGLGAVMAWGIHLVQSGSWQIGSLFPLFTWAITVSQNIWRIGMLEHQINYNLPSCKSLIKAISMERQVVDKPDAIALDHKISRTITLENVSHTYPPESKTMDALEYEEIEDKDDEEESAVISNDSENIQTPDGKKRMPSIQGISFAINPGDKVAILGPSGAGKSTLMKKLLRFDDPTDGRILIDGIDLRDLSQASWRQGIGYIAQQPHIFEGSIRYNLTYGLTEEERELVTDDQLKELMTLLKIDFGNRLTEGLDTKVGKGGLKLSGGQAQRLMIGAAVIRDPWLLIVDEATSSLDSTTEKEVQAGLAQILSDTRRSAIIIAHRLSTVRHVCNRFIILKPVDGLAEGESQIEAIASSFEELYAISPTFRRLADDQQLQIEAFDPNLAAMPPKVITAKVMTAKVPEIPVAISGASTAVGTTCAA